jgi:hypothetical protein
MPQLIATLLGSIIMALIAIGIAHRFEASLQREVYQTAVLQAARQEATFARAVLAYMATNTLTPESYITIDQLQQAGYLSPGFPNENPFGQSSRAIVGSNNAVIITYTFPPQPYILSELGQKNGDIITAEALALNEASAIAVMQEGLPSLVGGMMNGANFYTPFQTIVIPLGNYVSVLYLPGGVTFADLVNVVPTASLSSPTAGSYPAVTGD